MFLSNFTNNHLYTCGNLDFEFAGTFPYLVSTIITIIKIGVPILLIIVGMLDLGKSVIASKEDEIKKGQQILIKRAIAAVLVFFIIQVVQLVIGFISGDDNETIKPCFNCFVNGKVSSNGCIDTEKVVEE